MVYVLVFWWKRESKLFPRLASFSSVPNALCTAVEVRLNSVAGKAFVLQSGITWIEPGRKSCLCRDSSAQLFALNIYGHVAASITSRTWIITSHAAPIESTRKIISLECHYLLSNEQLLLLLEKERSCLHCNLSLEKDLLSFICKWSFPEKL